MYENLIKSDLLLSEGEVEVDVMLLHLLDLAERLGWTVQRKVNESAEPYFRIRVDRPDATPMLTRGFPMDLGYLGVAIEMMTLAEADQRFREQKVQNDRITALERQVAQLMSANNLPPPQTMIDDSEYWIYLTKFQQLIEKYGDLPGIEMKIDPEKREVAYTSRNKVRTVTKSYPICKAGCKLLRQTLYARAQHQS